MKEQLPEDIIKDNFFNLSFASQIKIMNLYLEQFEYYVKYKNQNMKEDLLIFKNTFKKYKTIIEQIIKFKEQFYKLDNEGKNELRKMMEDNYKKSPNHNNTNYYEKNKKITIDDSFIRQYENKMYSYDNRRQIKIILEFQKKYSGIINYDFDQTLGLCESNDDFFNNEIKMLSKKFYPLYIKMETREKIMHIWHLSHYNPDRTFEEDLEIRKKYYQIFGVDYIDPIPKENKKLEKYKEELKKDPKIGQKIRHIEDHFKTDNEFYAKDVPRILGNQTQKQSESTKKLNMNNQIQNKFFRMDK